MDKFQFKLLQRALLNDTQLPESSLLLLCSEALTDVGIWSKVFKLKSLTGRSKRTNKLLYIQVKNLDTTNDIIHSFVTAYLIAYPNG